MRSTFIFVLILLLIVLLILKIVKSIVPAFKSWKKNLYFAAGYLFILLIAALSVYFVPQDKMISSESTPEQIVFPSKTYHSGLSSGDGLPRSFTLDELGSDHSLTQADLEKQPGLYRKTSYEFQVKADLQQLRYVDDDRNKRVYIERKSVDDGKVEVITYLSSYLLNDVDITDQILPPSVAYSDGVIELGQQPEQNLNYKIFKHDFTVNQFRDNSSPYGPRFHFGWQVVLIRIPQSLTIITPDDLDNLNTPNHPDYLEYSHY